MLGDDELRVMNVRGAVVVACLELAVNNLWSRVTSGIECKKKKSYI